MEKYDLVDRKPYNNFYYHYQVLYIVFVFLYNFCNFAQISSP